MRKPQCGRFGLYDENDEALILSATDEDSKIHPSSVYGINKTSARTVGSNCL